MQSQGLGGPAKAAGLIYWAACDISTMQEAGVWTTVAEAGEIAAPVCAWVTLWGIHENESSLTAWAALIGNLFFSYGEPLHRLFPF